MSFSMASLLMHSTDVSSGVREQLRAAHAQPERRDDHLINAARMLYQELEIECADARELVGLTTGDC